MKIVINTENIDLYNAFSRYCKNTAHQVINAKVEAILFENIEKGDVGAFVLSGETYYFKKAVEFIKRNYPYIPVIAITRPEVLLMLEDVDVYMMITTPYELLVEAIRSNIDAYTKTFLKLQKLTAKMGEAVEFGSCSYDPTRRILLHKGKEVAKLSAKAGGILELLATNYGQVVKKEIILEKVWRKSDYFAGRSMDVYITNLRNTLKINKIKLSIKNISGIGLILE